MKKLLVLAVLSVVFLNAEFKNIKTNISKKCSDFETKLEKCNSLLNNHQRRMCRLNLFAKCK
ncbi:hypothetical protein JG677_07760 [Campylobacter sp. TTU-622]|uniref:hypothetical protein n=1 Tax=unclassified Campylobacter TaxID=2593542 RepID=UPI0019067095|nr:MULTISPECIES: hypothetical protein [unclassified Campylobacter]MBK1971290.1 hypothetical protein [Campylobacter sp. TTU_617]MBK1973938.1 hypothetical protein [Campylobacter sp. TTU-622]